MLSLDRFDLIVRFGALLAAALGLAAVANAQDSLPSTTHPAQRANSLAPSAAVSADHAVPPPSPAPDSTEPPSAPFAWGDFTWMNGQNRQASSPLQLGGVLTVGVYMDGYYSYSFHRPKDNTIVGSAVTGRDNEFTLNLASVNLDVNYNNVIGRVALQLGSMLNIVQETDGTPAHGRNLSTDNLKYIREATLGYHFDTWHGINLEMGIFASYIGLESYLTQENWSYQRSLVCDFTPFYFTGARLTMYPTDNLKIEPWVMNGWQSYGKWNSGNSAGLSVYYRPTESLGFIGNFYYGTDTKNTPGRVRFNHDNSILLRYLNNKGSSGLSKAAFSLNSHIGFEDGGAGLPGMDSAYFAGTSFANRLWFAQDRLALTLRAGVASNPTRYLAPVPAPATSNTTSQGYLIDPSNPNDASLRVWDYTATLDYMPSDFLTFRLEFTNRNASVPYFAGPGGTTAPDGYQPTPSDFTPDLRRWENRLVLAMNLRL